MCQHCKPNSPLLLQTSSNMVNPSTSNPIMITTTIMPVTTSTTTSTTISTTTSAAGTGATTYAGTGTTIGVNPTTRNGFKTLYEIWGTTEFKYPNVEKLYSILDKKINIIDNPPYYIANKQLIMDRFLLFLNKLIEQNMPLPSSIDILSEKIGLVSQYHNPYLLIHYYNGSSMVPKSQFSIQIYLRDIK